MNPQYPTTFAGQMAAADAAVRAGRLPGFQDTRMSYFAPPPADILRAVGQTAAASAAVSGPVSGVIAPSSSGQMAPGMTSNLTTNKDGVAARTYRSGAHSRTSYDSYSTHAQTGSALTQMVPSSTVSFDLPEDAKAVEAAFNPHMGPAFFMTPEQAAAQRARARAADTSLRILGQFASPEMLLDAGAPLFTLTQNALQSHIRTLGEMRGNDYTRLPTHNMNLDVTRPMPAIAPVTGSLDADIPYSLLEFGLGTTCGAGASSGSVWGGK